MSKKFVAGLLVGAALGTTAALLLAPKKGEELREELGDKSEDLKAVALDYLELLSEKGTELVQSTVDATAALLAQFSEEAAEDTLKLEAEEDLLKEDSHEDADDLLESKVAEEADDAVVELQA